VWVRFRLKMFAAVYEIAQGHSPEDQISTSVNAVMKLMVL